MGSANACESCSRINNADEKVQVAPALASASRASSKDSKGNEKIAYSLAQSKTFHDGQIRSNLVIKDGGFNVGSFAATQSGKVEDAYILEKEVGVGGFGSVRQARCRTTNRLRAVKCIARSAVPEPELMREEIDIMRLLDHPNIVLLENTFEDRCWVYVVMELCTGGELFSQIANQGCLSEIESCTCLRQMFLAVNYLHQNHIIHRDLKPENFLLATEAQLASCCLKLIDFGFAKRFTPGVRLLTTCGTLEYVAPEVISDLPYDHKADIWSLGIVWYLMFCGNFPWGRIKNEDRLMEAVKGQKISMDCKNLQSYSQDSRDLLGLVLTRNASQRPHAVQVLEHRWLQPETYGQTSYTRRLSQDDLKQLQAFGRMNVFKKAAVQLVMTQLKEEDIRNLREVFLGMDTNHDGTVSASELREGLVKSGMQLPKHFEELVEQIDTDGSGVVDFHEFMGATLDCKHYAQKEVLWAAFKRFDKDNNGFIDKSELDQVLSGEVRDAFNIGNNIGVIFAEVDKNGDGMVDFEEFFAMMLLQSGGDKEGAKPKPKVSAKRVKCLRK